MPVFPRPTVPTEEFPGIRFTTLVAPRFGSSDVAVCRVDIDPGTPATPHSLTREEIFVVLAGTAEVHVEDTAHQARPGDTILIPANTEFGITSADASVLELVVVLPVGGELNVPGGTMFQPPWSA